MKSGDKIVRLRKASGLSQIQLAEKLGVSEKTISKWEQNETGPDLNELILLIELYDERLDKMIKDEVQNDLNDGRMSMETLTEMNWYYRKKMILMITAILSLMIGSATIIILTALEETTVSLQYMGYRYIATGEYAYAPVSFKIPYIVAIIILCIGIICLLIYFKLKNKKDSKT